MDCDSVLFIGDGAKELMEKIIHLVNFECLEPDRDSDDNPVFTVDPDFYQTAREARELYEAIPFLTTPGIQSH